MPGAFLAAFLIAILQVPPAPTAAISGVVSDAATGAPLSGAVVSLVRLDRSNPSARGLDRPAVVTDARGRFAFTRLPAGRGYILFASHAGYGVGTYGTAGQTDASASAGFDSASITIAEGQWVSDANIGLWRPGSISGRVLDERGDAVVGTAVRAFSRRMIAGRAQLIAGPLAVTDDRGAYRLPFLAAGEYVVGVLSVQATVPASMPDAPRSLPVGALEGRGGHPSPASRPEVRGASIDADGRHRLVLSAFAAPPPPDGGRPRVYPPVFYPNGRTLDEAQPVALQAGSERSDVDIALSPVTAVTVAGRVGGAIDGAVNRWLRLMTPGTEGLGSGAEVATTVVETDGSFTFLNVPSGTYTLMTSPTVVDVSGGDGAGSLPDAAGYVASQRSTDAYPAAPDLWYLSRSSDGASHAWGRTSVSVGSADVADVALLLRRTVSVRGHVVFDGTDRPADGTRVHVSLEPSNGDSAIGVASAWTASNDDSRAFQVDGLLASRYLLRCSHLPDGWRVKSVLFDGVDVVDAGFDATLEKDYDDVVVTLTRTSAQVSGVVTDDRGRPVVSAVILFPADSREWTDYGLTPDRLRSVGAGSDGVYTLRSLPGGDYYVIAVPPDRQHAWVDARFLAAAATQAIRVSLGDGAQKTQDLRLTKVVVK